MLALEGIKVLDLSRLAPGPYCTMILADLGADVLKIEPPGAGIPFFAPPGVEEANWYAYNAHDRNKRSMVLNLRAEEGRQIFHKLAESTDVIVEGFRPGTAKRLGLDYETLKGRDLRIIYCSLSGFGQDGPYSHLAGHDPNYVAISGALSLIGPKDKAPSLPPNLLADFAAGGLQAALAILAALIVRERTGVGQYLDVAMLDGIMSLLASELSQYFVSGQVPKRGETWNTGAEPWGSIYETKDGGYITVAAGEPHFWQNLCQALGCDDLIPYHEPIGEKKAEVFRRFKEAFLLKTRDEWFEVLARADVPCGSGVYSGGGCRQPTHRPSPHGARGGPPKVGGSEASGHHSTPI
jgi:alpha-methylacyl-CoA racemase